LDVHHSSPRFIANLLAPTELYPLSLHDALPICVRRQLREDAHGQVGELLVGHPVHCLRSLSAFFGQGLAHSHARPRLVIRSCGRDRKSTRLNSSHGSISYAVFCLKKKKKKKEHM